MGDHREARHTLNRRGFLKVAGTVGGAAVALALQTDAAEAVADEAEGASGYSETGHVRAYYGSARL